MPSPPGATGIVLTRIDIDPARAYCSGPTRAERFMASANSTTTVTEQAWMRTENAKAAINAPARGDTAPLGRLHWPTPAISIPGGAIPRNRQAVGQES